MNFNAAQDFNYLLKNWVNSLRLEPRVLWFRIQFLAYYKKGKAQNIICQRMFIWYFSFEMFNVNGMMKLTFLVFMKMMGFEAECRWNEGWERKKCVLQGSRELMVIWGQKEGHLFGTYTEPTNISSSLLALSHIITTQKKKNPIE